MLIFSAVSKNLTGNFLYKLHMTFYYGNMKKKFFFEWGQNPLWPFLKNQGLKNFVKKIFEFSKNFFFIPLGIQRPTTMQNFSFLTQSSSEIEPFFSFSCLTPFSPKKSKSPAVHWFFELDQKFFGKLLPTNGTFKKYIKLNFQKKFLWKS